MMTCPGSSRRLAVFILVALVAMFSAADDSPAADSTVPSCTPTPADALGPFYKPGAPLRDSVGKGYVLSGKVMSASGCVPLAGSVIEFWLAGPEGDYLDAYRATMKAKPDGSYRFECAPPPPYERRPPHIHIRVTAPGHQTLVTQHYPASGTRSGFMDLVLIPSR